MELRSIERDIWESYFTFISKLIAGQYVEIEVAGIDFGSQIEESWVPLGSLSYEPRSNTLFVRVEGLDHAISEPLEVVSIEDIGASVKSIAIKDHDGNVQIITFRAPLLLGAGRGTSAPSPISGE